MSQCLQILLRLSSRDFAVDRGAETSETSSYMVAQGEAIADIATTSPCVFRSSRLRKKGKALSRSVWSLNCLGGIRHVIGQFE